MPLLPDGTLPPLMLLVRWLARMREDQVRVVALHRLPPGNGIIPDVLSLAGIPRVELLSPVCAGPFRWEGCAGGRCAVNGDDDGTLPVHHGHLPSTTTGDGDSAPLLALVDLARLEDANGVHDHQAAGAAWDYILAAVGLATPPRLSPLAARGATTAISRLGAWNPLPFPRHAAVALAMSSGTPPWGLQDEHGARHPVQVVEGPLGRELLAVLPFGALAGQRLEPLLDPVPGVHWEASRTVLDNGRVRVEFDPLGQVVRLCCDGNFLDLAGPAFTPLCDGLPLAGPATMTLLEDGPVRARLDVRRDSPQGTLHLTYTVQAHDEVLRVAASWQGDGELTLDVPTSFRGELGWLGSESASWPITQSASVTTPTGDPWSGITWAMLGADAGGKGILLVGARPLNIAVQAGHFTVQVHAGTLVAIGSALRSAGALPPSALARSLAVPARSFSAGRTLPAAFRLVGGLTPLWVRRPEEWSGELLLSDTTGARGSATLFLAQGARQAWRVDAGGAPLAPLTPTADGDGFDIDYPAHGILLVRWR